MNINSVSITSMSYIITYIPKLFFQKLSCETCYMFLLYLISTFVDTSFVVAIMYNLHERVKWPSYTYLKFLGWDHNVETPNVSSYQYYCLYEEHPKNVQNC